MGLETISRTHLLGIGVHPDDIELGAIGTLIKHKNLGYDFGLCDLTRGELGTRGSADIRDQESMHSAQISGATFRVNLKMRDGFFQSKEENLNAIIRVIRAARPDIILANAIRDRHPDHGRAASMTKHAIFLAGLPKVKTTINGIEQEPWSAKKTLHYIQDYNLQPTVAVDITKEIDQKMECILAFKSQFFDPNSAEPKTPISSSDFLDFVKGRCRAHGRHIGASYAEGFTTDTHLGVKDLYHLI